MIKIFLCGFMGCGKSTLAKLISQHLPLKFVDSDSEIEKRFNLSVSNIFSKFGEETFRKMETNVLNNIVDMKNQNLIVATGGATLISNNNFELLNSHCKTIMINTNFDICFKRIEKSSRPLLRLGPEKLKQLFLKRQPFYFKTAHKILTETCNSNIQTKLQMTLKLINTFKH